MESLAEYFSSSISRNKKFSINMIRLNAVGDYNVVYRLFHLKNKGASRQNKERITGRRGTPEIKWGRVEGGGVP